MKMIKRVFRWLFGKYETIETFSVIDSEYNEYGTLEQIIVRRIRVRRYY